MAAGPADALEVRYVLGVDEAEVAPPKLALKLFRE